MVIVPRIAAVSYPDTTPFLYGIRREGNFRAELTLSAPEDCIRRMNEGAADLALVPASAVPSMQGVHPVTGYCIGAAGAAGVVLAAGCGPMAEARRLVFDADRETEVQLAAFVLRKRWNIDPEPAAVEAGGAWPDPAPGDLHLLAGERVWTDAARYAERCDLTAEWRRATRLPFVFRVWVAREGVDEEWIEGLHAALTYGIEHAYEALLDAGYADRAGEAYAYLTAFDCVFDNEKRKALQKFWDSGVKVSPRANPG